MVLVPVAARTRTAEQRTAEQRTAEQAARAALSKSRGGSAGGSLLLALRVVLDEAQEAGVGRVGLGELGATAVFDASAKGIQRLE